MEDLEKNNESGEPIEFTDTEKAEIESKRQVLSSLAYFVGKDFNIPVELNQPGQGWHWDFKANMIRIDPKDLLEKPMDYLRFVISHEGGHRRISRPESIPLETWQQPGFSFMMNAIEDPRDNNFVAENYPRFKNQMDLAYEIDQEFEQKAKAAAQKKLGREPRFIQAGLEYIKQWFREERGEEVALSDDLLPEVREVAEKTLKAARDSWWTYPSRQEADSSEELIQQYAEASYRINLERVWPEFKKLVEADLEDQKTQELMQEMQENGKGGGAEIPQELKDKLTPEEIKELEAGEGKPIEIESLSEDLKKKIKEYLDSLPEEKKKELEAKVRVAIKELEDELNQSLEGQLNDNPEKKSQRGDEERGEGKTQEEPKKTAEEIDEEGLRKYREMVEKAIKSDTNIYEAKRREVIEIVDQLERDLREIFVVRRSHQWQSGFRSGKRIDIKRRIQEKVKGISAVQSRSWERREMPQEKDYAISLLIDLSSSMKGEKIEETFKAAIVLAEALNRLSIRTEILGFNDRLYEYQRFGENIKNETRENMGGMFQEVGSERARWNDDGWAVEQASLRLAKQRAQEKFLIILSDGIPEESSIHPRAKYELKEIVDKIIHETDQKLIGLGIGRGTEHVENYYPSSLAGVNVLEMAEKLADLIREVIENYDQFQ